MEKILKTPQKINIEVKSLENYFLTENEKRIEMLIDYYSSYLYGLTEEELDYEYREKLGD